MKDITFIQICKFVWINFSCHFESFCVLFFGPGFLKMATGLLWFLCVGVLLCRGTRLLTGSNTRWLRLWEVEAVWGAKPQEKVKERSAAHCLMVLCVLYVNPV